MTVLWELAGFNRPMDEFQGIADGPNGFKNFSESLSNKVEKAESGTNISIDKTSTEVLETFKKRAYDLHRPTTDLTSTRTTINLGNAGTKEPFSNNPASAVWKLSGEHSIPQKFGVNETGKTYFPLFKEKDEIWMAFEFYQYMFASIGTESSLFQFAARWISETQPGGQVLIFNRLNEGGGGWKLNHHEFNLGTPASNDKPTASSPVCKNKEWYQFLVHAKFSGASKDGILEIWIRKKGEAWPAEPTFKKNPCYLGYKDPAFTTEGPGETESAGLEGQPTEFHLLQYLQASGAEDHFKVAGLNISSTRASAEEFAFGTITNEGNNMAYDKHINFGYTTVETTPSSPESNTEIKVVNVTLPAPPFNAVIWPIGQLPLSTNAEIVRVEANAAGKLTVKRKEEGSTARSIKAGDQFMAAVTAKTLTDIEAVATVGAYENPVFGAKMEQTTPEGKVRSVMSQTFARGAIRVKAGETLEVGNTACTFPVGQRPTTTYEAFFECTGKNAIGTITTGGVLTLNEPLGAGGVIILDNHNWPNA